MYFNGTVSVKKGSKQLIGVGTKFKYAMANISAGQLITIDSSTGREINIIQSIQSNEELTLFWDSKVDISNATYVISTTISGSLPDFGQKNSATVQWANKLIDGISQLMTSQSDMIKIEMPYGEIVELKTYKSKISVGDFGIGSSPLSAGISPPFPLNANDATNGGLYAGGGTNANNYFDKYSPLWAGVRQGGDGSGTVVQFQFSADGKKLACRVRDRNTWGSWCEFMSLDGGGLQKLNGSLVASSHRIGANPLSATRDGNDYLNLYPAKNPDGQDLAFFQYNFGNIWNGQLYVPRVPSGGREYLISSGINNLSGRVLTFKASAVNQACYFESLWTDGSSRWRLGSTDFTSNFEITTGGGATLTLTKDKLTANRRNVVQVGDFGVGSGKLVSENRFDDFGSGLDSGFYSYVNPKQVPDGVTAYGNVISIQYDAQNWQKLIFSNYGAYFHVQRCINGSRSTVQVMTKDMWTVDGNGFYKKSSPIIKIKPSGDFVVNDESEGAVVEKIGVGHYRVLNTEGFHSDLAWGVDGGVSVPKDHNDNPLIWIEPEVNADGSIDIYTFHRENYIPDSIRKMRERRLNKMGGTYSSKVDGEPCDIPEGAFIDVRVEMPYNSIYNIKKRAIERVLALENIIRVQGEIMNSKIKLLTKK